MFILDTSLVVLLDSMLFVSMEIENICGTSNKSLNIGSFLILYLFSLNFTRYLYELFITRNY